MICNEEDTDGRARVTTDEERVLPSVCPSDGGIIEQESCAIAKMTARCALYK